MLAWLRQKRNLSRTAGELYGSIVAQARSRGLYARLGAPDTTDGRFEVIALHLVLVLRRLAREGREGSALGQALTETFVVDVDDTLREMTVGDLAVPRHVKRAVAALHDRYSVYDAALSAPRNDLADAVRGRLGTLNGAEGLDVEGFCAYIREAAQGLEDLSGSSVLSGALTWPNASD